MSEYNRDSSDGVIVTPSRRLFLGSLVAGSTVGLSGCSLFDFLGGSGTSNTRTTSNNDFGFDFPDENDSSGRLIKGKKSKSKSRKKVARRRTQRSKRSLSLGRYNERELAFHNTHTGERLRIAYWEDGRYVPGALREINHLMRDHRRNESHRIDTKLLDQLFILRKKLGTSKPFHIISGYRSPKTNALLRSQGRRGVAKRSLHMSGRAIDIRMPGRSLSKVRLAALSMHAGGVGYYPGANFVHLDTGRVRRW